MATLTVTNNSSYVLHVPDPGSSLYLRVLPTETGSIDLDALTASRMGDIIRDLSNNSDYVVDYEISAAPADQIADVAKGDVARWLGNRVTVGMAVANPSTGSSASARRVNIAAGEIYVDGVHTSYAAAANDNVGDIQVTAAGADQGVLAPSTTYKAALVYYWHSAVLKRAFVFSAGGASAAPTEAEVAAAIQAKHALAAPAYAHVRVANVTFALDGSSAVTQTTTSVRGFFASY